MATSLLNQMVEPFAECFTAESATKIAALRASPELQRRIDELADKANLGRLSTEEKAEYDRYLASLHLVSLLQSLARRFLKG